MDLMRGGTHAVVFIAVVLALSASVASAQKTEFAFGLGYSHLSMDDTPGEMDQQDGGRFDARFSWLPFDERPQLRFGIGLGFSYYYDKTDAGDIISPPFAFGVDSYESVSIITPEFQVSCRQPMSEKWWIEGGVGIGPAIGYYSAGDVVFDELFDEDVSETEVGLGIRPFLRAGFRGGNDWRWGVEGSYQWTSVDFDRFGSDPDEWYVGLFIAFGR